MAIGPIGNVIFVNQMTPVAAGVQNAHNHRIDFQNMAAQAAVNEKEEKVLEVRPAEEIQKIDEDREHQRDEADRESQRNKKREEEADDEAKESATEEEEASEEPPRHLDITV